MIPTTLYRRREYWSGWIGGVWFATIIAVMPAPASAEEAGCMKNCRFTGSTTIEDLITKQPVSDVRAFGAKGDGATDDTTAIQAALNFAEHNHGIVFFPRGAYKITSPLKLAPNVHIEGLGVGFGSVIVPYKSVGFSIRGADLKQYNHFGFRNRIRGVTIVMKNAPQFPAIMIDNAYTLKLEEVFVFDAGEGGGITIAQANHVTVTDVSVYGNGKGAGISVIDSDVKLYDMDIEGFRDGLVVQGDHGVHVFGGYIERNDAYAIKFQNASFNTIVGARVAAGWKGASVIGFLNGSHNNTVIGSSLNGLDGPATLVQDDASRNNLVINSDVRGGVKQGASTLAVWNSFGTEPPR
ncbi:MAG TPA: glycosyl hydrolase family 28-related protein [Nitrospiria bacterium]|nr:glycosyl hydrolase family 28-related protein [Nitrospiria bacterium]